MNRHYSQKIMLMYAHPLVFPSTTCSMGSPEMKSSSDGPVTSVSRKLDFKFGVEADGIAKCRTRYESRQLERGRKSEFMKSKWADIVTEDNACHVMNRKSGGPHRQKRQFYQRLAGSKLCKSQVVLMNTLSRREEDTLLKTTKARALTECDSIVKGSAMHSSMIKNSYIDFVSLRIRQLRNRTYAVCGMGLQGQVQSLTGVYATIVSPTALSVWYIE